MGDPFAMDSPPVTLSAEYLAQTSLSFGDLALDGDDVYFVEGRANEGGRRVIVRAGSDGVLEDILPAGWDVRTRVHDYGGGAFLVSDGTVYFSAARDGRIYRVAGRRSPGAGCAADAPEPGVPTAGVPTAGVPTSERLAPNAAAPAPDPVTPAGEWRYADFALDSVRRRLLCVLETPRAGREPQNALAAVALGGERAITRAQPASAPASRRESQPAQPATRPPRVLHAEHDFYAAPRVSPDGCQLAFVAWNHPHMPWDEAELWLADIAQDGELTDVRRIAGGAGEAVQQPVWSPAGVLHFVSDKSGWWNIYRVADGGRVDAVLPMAAEFGAPPWVFGVTLYGFDRDGEMWCAFWQDGVCRLARLPGGRLAPAAGLGAEFTDFENLKAGGAGETVVAALAAGPKQSRSLVAVRDGRVAVLRRSSADGAHDAWLAAPESIRFTAADGEAEGQAFFYRPSGPRGRGNGRGEPETAPPLLVFCHGGPTGQATSALNGPIQYFASRGFAVLDVNYGGSTGHGRRYRERLRHGFGEVDVDDCVRAAQTVAGRGDVDPRRMAIRGKSSGGYTVLRALARTDVFCAGVAHYALADLEGMLREGPKFESHYAEWLVGPYPDELARYRERSPLYHAELIRQPVLLLHGADDTVVPVQHSIVMADALRARGTPVAQLVFAGEGHGFRAARTIRRAFEAELSFYAQVLGVTVNEQLVPLEIAHWRG